MAQTTLGNFIKARRLERGLTQTGLSEAIGLSSSYVGCLERGMKPSDKALRALERALDCQIPRSLPCTPIKTSDGEPWFKVKRKTVLAEKITRQRLVKGFSQAKTAELAGIPLYFYQGIEVGTRTPTKKQMTSISAALDLDLKDTTPLTPYVPTRLRNGQTAVQLPYDVVQPRDGNSDLGGMTITISDESRQDIERILALSGLHSQRTVVERALIMMRRCMEVIAPEDRASLAS